MARSGGDRTRLLADAIARNMGPLLFVETDVNPDSLVKRAIDATVESAEVNSGNAHLSAHRA
jgi:hypothetical protein